MTIMAGATFRNLYIRFLLNVVLMYTCGFGQSKSLSQGTSTESNSNGIYVELEGGIQLVYQIPKSNKALTGVLLVAHGCSHSATDWWPKSQNCSTCIGLPVERSIVRMAIERNMAVVAVTSSNRQHKCWVLRSDKVPVITAIKYVYQKAGLTAETASVPLYLLGASSGGSFVGSFAQEAKSEGLIVSAICVQIMFIKIHRFDEGMIPALFVHMPLESHTKKMISSVIDQINRHSPNSAKELLCLKKAIEPTYFNDHGAALTIADSAALTKAFKDSGLLSPQHFLLENPRESNWREVSMLKFSDVTLFSDG
jgi:hypothetical protein